MTPLSTLDGFPSDSLWLSIKSLGIPTILPKSEGEAAMATQALSKKSNALTTEPKIITAMKKEEERKGPKLARVPLRAL